MVSKTSFLAFVAIFLNEVVAADVFRSVLTASHSRPRVPHQLQQEQASAASKLLEDPNCLLQSDCRQCTFEEWRTAPECTKSGYALEIMCINQKVLVECDRPPYYISRALAYLALLVATAVACGLTFVHKRETLEQQYLKAYRERR